MLGINLDFSLYYIFICILIGFGYAFLLYRRQEKPHISKDKLVLFIFRMLFTSLLAFLLLNPFLNSRVQHSENPIIIIAKDNSTSIKDGDINNKLQSLKEAFKGFEVFLYSFSDKLYDGLSEYNNGLKTNYHEFFSELHNKFENRNVAGVIIASDGCFNTGYNPEYLTYDFPVYSIALGDTSTYVDLRIDDVLKNDIAFFGNTFPLEISLASNIENNHDSKLKIYNDGDIVHESTISFLKDVDYKTYSVILPADNIGLQTYTIEIEPLSAEQNTSNNIFTTYIDVLDSRFNILILKSGNSPDLAAYLSTITDNKNYNIKVQDINDDFILEKYQLLVTFGVNNITDKIIDNDIPLLIFNASQSHYDDFKSPIRFISKGGLEEIGCYKIDDFSKFSFSSNLLSFIADAPPLYTEFGSYDFKGKVECVLNQRIGVFESKNPVIFIHYLNSRKVCFVSAQGWWKWKFYDFSLNKNNNLFNEFFSKLSQYLILKEEKSLFRLQYEKQHEENNEIVFRASLFNESYELVNNKEVDLKIFDQKGQTYNFQFSREDNELVARLGVLEVGTYSFTAHVAGTDLKKNGVFDVKEIQIEKLGLSVNHQILKKIAKISGGKMFYPNDHEKLTQTIKNSGRVKKIIHYQESNKQIINMPAVLFLLLALVSFEWFARKYNGLI